MQLILLGLATAGEVATRVDVYDDGWVEVVMPAVSVSVDQDHGTVGATWTADILSGATTQLDADLVSSATTYSETRHQLDVQGLTRRHDWQLGAGLSESREPDHRSHSGGVELSRELFESMSTVSVGYGLSVQRGGRVDQEQAWQRSVEHAMDLTWTQILGRRTVMSVLVYGAMARCGEQLGCYANAYRFVPLEKGLVVPERNPHQLGRAAAALRFAQALGNRAALLGGYRFYQDTWEVRAHTADLTARLLVMDERLMLSGTGRYSNQSGALFGASPQVADLAVPGWRSADRELSGFVSQHAGLRAEWSFFGVGPWLRLGVSARGARMWTTYLEGSERAAWMVGVGLTGER
ncbi:MAG: DUF3570 domain-containing protein [Proteobacteria bacterium]|nr:DUF3570 domain-containing protein [Pseudomonadota bacterium]